MSEGNFFSYPGLKAYTLQDSNSSYLSNLTYKPTPTPVSGPSLGLMMLISTLQYQSPYMNPTYSNAASQAGKAAFIQSGGQGMQDKVTGIATKDATDFAHSVGITDTEIGIIGFSMKTYKDRQVSFRGPTIGNVHSNLTGTENSGSIGLKYEW